MNADWTPFFWEPVEGAGERLMAGVVVRFNGEWTQHRFLRDEILDSLYGRASASPRRLIDHALGLALSIAREGGLQAIAELRESLLGLHAGKSRTTDAHSIGDALKQAALMHASLVQLDGLDDGDESENIPPEEVNKRFATEVREIVVSRRPDLVLNFGRSGRITSDGPLIRFGYVSNSTIAHFSVLHPIRQAASVKDARAKLWELFRAQAISQHRNAALITAVPRSDDPTLGSRQLAAIAENRRQIEQEADDVHMRLYPVISAAEAAAKVLELEI